MAEAIARAAAEDIGLVKTEFRSAGTSAVPGLPASPGALRAARRNGLELEDHRSTPLSPDLVEWADLILTMGPSHLIRALELGGEGKSLLLGEFASGDDPSIRDPSVPDPYGGDDQIYEATFHTLDHYVNDTLERLVREREGS